MLRGYGGGVQAFLQEPNSETTRALFKHDVEQALALFMPEARLTAPLTLRADDDGIKIVIQYVASPQQVVQRLELTFPG
jgi:phage baseplate assembly protein W